MERSGFGDRLGFLLWFRHLVAGSAPTYEDIGKAVGRSGVAVSAWRVREEPPPDYRLHDPLSDFFEADRKWVIDGEGHPPEPDLWKVWCRYRRSDDTKIDAVAISTDGTRHVLEVKRSTTRGASDAKTATDAGRGLIKPVSNKTPARKGKRA